MDSREKQYNYVYLTTNIINGKQYVGDHSTDDIDSPKSKNYLGSGVLIKKKIKQYGKTNFKKEILEFFSDKEKAHNSQEKYIIKHNTLVPHGYNISPKGGTHYNGNQNNQTIEKIRKSSLGKKRSQETIEKIRLSKLNITQETRDKIGFASRNRSSEANYRCGSTNRGKETWMKGKKHLKKSIESNRIKHIGKEKSEKTKEKNRIASSGSNNPMYGKNFYSIWLEKYGKEIADTKYLSWKNNLIKTK